MGADAPLFLVEATIAGELAQSLVDVGATVSCLTSPRKSPEEHAKDVRMVLQALREANFYCKRSKCHFNQPEVEYLGHIVNKGRGRP